MEKEQRLRFSIILVFFIPIFIAVGFFANRAYEARSYDFAAYWQAAYMVSNDGDIYNTEDWVSVREEQQTALHSEIVFQYPLPLAVLMSARRLWANFIRRLVS